MVIIVFTRYKVLRTMTNYFLGNLAVADFMISIFCVIPQMLRSVFHIYVNLVCRRKIFIIFTIMINQFASFLFSR